VTPLRDGEVHVWRIPLGEPVRRGRPPEPLTDRLTDPLTSEEHARARRFRHARDRASFVAARGALRRILAHYLATAPGDLVFEYGAFGKPALAGRARCPDIRFNLAHSGEVAVLAVTCGRDVGVDVEVVDPSVPFLEVAAATFSELEVAELRSLPAGELARGFYNCWTRKEALVKAVGLGLSLPLTAFDVSLAPLDEPRLLASREPRLAGNGWRLCDVTPGPAYVGAVAIAPDVRHGSGARRGGPSRAD